MMEKIIGKKEKWANKGNDKQWVTISLIHSAKLCILGQVFQEKSVTDFSYSLHRRER